MFKPKTSTVLAAAALVVAVFGSTPLGNAAGNLILAKNSVGTAQLKRNAVTGVKVKDGTLTAVDFKAGALRAGQDGEPRRQTRKGAPSPSPQLPCFPSGAEPGSSPRAPLPAAESLRKRWKPVKLGPLRPASDPALRERFASTR